MQLWVLTNLLSSFDCERYFEVLSNLHRRPVCRQCPAMNNRISVNRITRNVVQTPDFTCSPMNTTHVLCHCCNETMPQRLEPEMAARQQCVVCRTHYCRQYFGCSNACPDCLMPLKGGLLVDFDWQSSVINVQCLRFHSQLKLQTDLCLWIFFCHFSDSSLDGPIQFDLINRNAFESRVLLDYLRDKNITLRQLMILCAENFTTHQYFTPTFPSMPLTPESLVCRNCSHRLFRDFAYHYRAAIEPNDLPAEVRIRPNCRWGKNCRTQLRQHHAQ